MQLLIVFRHVEQEVLQDVQTCVLASGYVPDGQEAAATHEVPVKKD